MQPQNNVKIENKYGQQEAYQRCTQDLIKWGAHQIKTAIKDDASLTKLFFDIFNHFRKERQNIAAISGTLNAQEFGLRRDQEMLKDVYQTILDQDYEKYNSKFLEVFARQIEDMFNKKGAVIRNQNSLKEVYKANQIEINSSFAIEIIEKEKLNQLRWNCPVNTIECSSQILVNLLEKRMEKGEEHLSELEKEQFRKEFRNLKDKNSELYKRFIMFPLFSLIAEEFPSPVVKKIGSQVSIIGKEENLKSFFILGTARIEVKKQLYATTRYLTWLYRDNVTHPVDRMLKCSKIILIHQDNFLIQETLSEISEIFAKAILVKKDDILNLKTHIGLMIYYFAHCMPTARGSAAILEWFEAALYQSHDLVIKRDKSYKVDLEALTTVSLKNFMSEYNKMTELSILSP